MFRVQNWRKVWIIALFAAIAAHPEVLQADQWRAGSDLRAGIFASERERRDGSTATGQDLRARLRFSLQRDLGAGWRFRSRVAGSFRSSGNDFDLRFDRYRATPTGTLPGEVHFDEFHLQRIGLERDYRLRLGRFQTAFNLPVVPGKSLDRNDSSNVGIGWTDGFHLELPMGDSWRAHWIGQLNHRRGAGNTVRSPLTFDDHDSRLASYVALEASRPVGPISWGLISLNWMPDALAPLGTASRQREDYLTASAKAAATWPLGNAGMKLVAAGEVSHAFNRPRKAVMQLDGSGDAGGSGYQASINLFDFLPAHHLGLVYGRAQAGWLISNDYRNNDELAEVRYQHRFTPALSLEVRYRWRRELERRIAAGQLQVDRDVYARITWRIR